MHTITKIIIKDIKNNKGKLIAYNEDNIVLETEAYIGKNRITENKVEGDGKTPIGKYKLGNCFGTHKKEEVQNANYIEINEDIYWIDDVESKYYNQMVDIRTIKKDWISGEHIIEYKRQYEYVVEIKTNPLNIPYKGSAIFLHCSICKPTQGCIAIETSIMEKIINKINENTVIEILN